MQIELTKGLYALVDDEDFEELNKVKWCAIKGRYTYYAVRGVRVKGEGRNIGFKMHRVILKLSDRKIFVDHIDGNGLNNQKSNLRKSTCADNRRNSKGNKIGSSMYKGVFWNKENKKWRSKIGFNGEKIFIGDFTNEIECAKAYDKKAMELFGEFAYLNFK